MDFGEAMDVMDGLMLGDGGLRRYGGGARYQMALCKPLASCGSDSQERVRLRLESLPDHLRWEQWIADNVLTALHIPVSEGYPKAIPARYSQDGKSYQRGDQFWVANLTTRQSGLLTYLHNDPDVGWYAGGEWARNKQGAWYMYGATKVLPRRLMQATELPASTLAIWFLGDGSSVWYRTGVVVRFATHCFTKGEVYHLMGMLNNMGMNTVKPSRAKEVVKGPGLSIRLAQDSVNHFMDLIEPTIMEIFGDSPDPSYKYLIKRRP